MKRRKNPLWETIAIFAAIFSLWPVVMRYWAAANENVSLEDLPLSNTINWMHPAFDVLTYAALGVMVIVAVRRLQRIRELQAEQEDLADESKGPIDPYQAMLPKNDDTKHDKR